jgi:parvulin-like peptidyl-prolyl isomerase
VKLDSLPRQKRLALLIFGTAVVVAIAGYGIGRGFGQPEIPSGDIAVVEDVPDDVGHISREDFDRAMVQTAARAGIEEVPEPGDNQYENIKNAAIGDLLDTVWIEGEAADRGISVSEREIDAQLRQIKTQSFRNEREYEQFLERSGFTEEDIRLRVELQLLSDDIQQEVAGSAPSVSEEEIEEFYEAGESQFEQPEQRDVRLILNEDRGKVLAAKAALEEDDSDASWEEVAQRYSTDATSKSNGGLRAGLTEGLLEPQLDRPVFAAERGELEGPVKTPLGYYVFEVQTITPAHQQTLEELSEQIRSQLQQQGQQEAFSAFVDDYGSKWQSRTFCDSDFRVDRCANFKGTGHPANAQPQCYEEDPKGGRPACPAPVLQTQPALPGTVSPINLSGVRLPQTPHPPGAGAPAPATGLPGAVPGAPTTVAP